MPHDRLSVREVAWLCRVNDDTVRKWVRDAGLATTADGAIEWDVLSRWLAPQGRFALRPRALTLTNADLEELERLHRHSAGADGGVGPQAAEAAHLRRAMREILVAQTHATGEKAALGRAISQLLDVQEVRSEAGPNEDGWSE